MSPRIQRPLLQRDGPDRRARNFYRSASDDPDAVAGIPLNSVEAAATAAVRLGYKVAAEQIDRMTRIGKRLREEGDRAAGPNSDVKALDATEQIIFKTMMAGLSWFEGIAADNANPLKRLATAQFKMFGSLFGLLADDQQRTGASTDTAAVVPPSDRDDDRAGASMARDFDGAPTLRARPQIKHVVAPTRKGKGIPGAPRPGRAVHIQSWHIPTRERAYPLTFYATAAAAPPISGELIVTVEGTSTLSVKTSAKTVGGRYLAAICDDAGIQVGHIHIVV
jgi:hypothetical protein